MALGSRMFARGAGRSLARGDVWSDRWTRGFSSRAEVGVGADSPRRRFFGQGEHMQALTIEQIRALSGMPSGPCVSIYLPTHRHHPDNQQDPIRYRNLVKAAEESLARKYAGRETRALVEPLRALGTNSEFWNHTLDGLAVLATAERFEVIPLQETLRELVVVADSPHLKPLFHVTQSAERFQALCLTRKSARIYEGNRFVLDPIDANGKPVELELTEVLGDQLTEPYSAPSAQRSGTTGMGGVHHGTGTRKDEVDKDMERFFRAVDREVLKYSKASGLPLILVTLPENHATFRSVSQNGALVEARVNLNPDAVSNEELRAAAWSAMEPEYLGRLAKLRERFGAASAHGKGTGDLSDAARAAVAGRIGTLLIEDARVIAGRIDPETGAIEKEALVDPEVDDILDDLAELGLRTGAEVFVVPADQMPTDSGVAAIYKY